MVLTNREVTSLVEHYTALGDAICSDLKTRSRFKRLNANLDAGIVWCLAISQAMKDGFYPCVVLSAKKYEAALSVLQLADEMDDEKKFERYRLGHSGSVL